MTSILWDNKFLDDFAEELRRTPSIQFWECDTDGNVMDFKPEHYKKMLNKFYPALGVANLQLGQSDKGTPTSTLVFVRGNRVEQIDPQTLKQITFRIFNLEATLLDKSFSILLFEDDWSTYNSIMFSGFFNTDVSTEL